jgi:hypothetical protein
MLAIDTLATPRPRLAREQEAPRIPRLKQVLADVGIGSALPARCHRANVRVAAVEPEQQSGNSVRAIGGCCGSTAGTTTAVQRATTRASASTALPKALAEPRRGRTRTVAIPMAIGHSGGRCRLSVGVCVLLLV